MPGAHFHCLTVSDIIIQKGANAERTFPNFFKCFVDRLSRYICVITTNLMQYLSSVYFINQPLHVSGVFVAHHQEVYCIYTTIGTCCAFQLTVCWPGQQSTTCTNCCIYSIPPDGGLQICPKHVEVDWRNKLRINSASSWFLLHRFPNLFCFKNERSNNSICLQAHIYHRDYVSYCLDSQIRNDLLSSAYIQSSFVCQTVCYVKTAIRLWIVSSPLCVYELKSGSVVNNATV